MSLRSESRQRISIELNTHADLFFFFIFQKSAAACAAAAAGDEGYNTPPENSKKRKGKGTAAVSISLQSRLCVYCCTHVI